MFIHPVTVKALSHYRLFLAFSDGVNGVVDLSDLAGQGVFVVWTEPGFFERVHIGDQREIRWNEDIELCADSLYLRITGKSPVTGEKTNASSRVHNDSIDTEIWLKAFNQLQRSLGLTPAKAAEWQTAVSDARR